MSQHAAHRSNANRRGRVRGALRPAALLLALVRRASRFWLDWLAARWSALREWRADRARARAFRAEQGVRTALESLEPRLLLSADLMPTDSGVGLAADSRLVGPSVADAAVAAAAGSPLTELPQAHASATAPVPATTLNLSGPGAGVLLAREGGYVLQLQGTSAATTISLTVEQGGQTRLLGISADSAVGTLSLANADLAGEARFAGAVGSLTLGQVSQSLVSVAGAGDMAFKATSVADSRLSAPLANLAVTVDRWTSSAAGASRIDAAGLKSLSATGDLASDLFLSGMASGYTLGVVSVGGAISGGLWSIHGRGNSVTAGSTAAGWRLNSSGPLAQLATKGDASGDLALAGLQLLQVGGSARGLHLLVGADLGDDAALGGTGANADSFRAGTLARVRISGDVVDSSLFVSVDPVNGVLGDGNDRQVGTVVQRIQEFIVGGQLLGQTSVVAPAFPTSVRVGGQNLNPASLRQFSAAPADTTAPVLASIGLDLGSDTGDAGDNRTTRDTVTLIGITEAGATIALRRSGSSTVIASATAGSDGRFSLSGLALQLGDDAFTVSVSDAAGNTTQASLTVTREAIPDTSAPSLSIGLQTDTGRLGDDRITSDPHISGHAADDVAVTVLRAAIDPAGQTPIFSDILASLQPGGSFTLTRQQMDQLAGGSLADGAHTLRVQALDAAGNSTLADLSFTLDTQAPTATLALAAASDTGATGDNRTTLDVVTLTGQAEPGTAVELRRSGSSTLLGSATVGADGLITFAGLSLNMGDNSFTLSLTDAAGNAGSTSLTVVRDEVPDTTAPTLTNLRLLTDSGSSATDGITNTVTLLGSTADNKAVTRLLLALDAAGGNPNYADLSNALAADGSFSITRAQLEAATGATLADGPYTVQLLAEDAAGNRSAPSTISFTLDTQAPTGTLELAPESDSEPLGDNETTATSVTLLGQTAPGTVVRLANRSAAVDASGQWRLTDVALALGANTLEVSFTDAAGNTGTASAVITRTSISVDSTPPAISDLRLQTDSGSSANDRITNTVTILGQASDDTAVTKLLGALDAGGNTVAYSNLTTSLAADGSFTITRAQLNTLAGDTLADGPHTLQLVAEDAAGNRSAVASLSFTLDTQAPTATLALAAASDTDATGDNRTTLDVVTLTGQAEPGTAVELRHSGSSTLLGSATVGADGLITFAGLSLKMGDNSFTLSLTDAAGNTGSTSLTVVRDEVPDTTAPTLTNLRLQTDSGGSATDGITNTGTLLGSAADNKAVTKLLLALDAAGGNPNYADLSSALAADGSFSITRAQMEAATGATLADGPHTVQLLAEDAAGNRSAPSTLSFTLDTQAPTATLALAAASDTGTAGDNQTTLASVSLTGQAAPGTALELRRSGTSTLLGSATVGADGLFSFSNIALDLGDNAFTLSLSDATGNTGSTSLTVVRISETVADTTPPTVANIRLQADTGSSAADRITNTVTVLGQASDNTGVSRLLATLQAGDTPTYADLTSSLAQDGSFSISRSQLNALAGGSLADGARTLRIVAEDAAGNRSTAGSLAFTLDTAAPTGASFAISSADALNGDSSQTSAAITVLRGTAEPGATITLAAQGLSTTASGSGAFQLPGVALATGANSLTLTVSDSAGNSQTVTRTLTRVQQAQSDAVLDWINLALNAVQLDVTDPPVATRNLALVSLAQYDTLAAIEGTPAYLVQSSVSGPVNAQVAAATAAHRVLSLTYPAQKATFDAALTAALAQVADGAAKDTAIALGLSVADAVLAARANDGADAFATYSGSTATGQWRPTGPTFEVADHPQWKTVQPFALTSPSQFRPAAPPALDTSAYAAAVNEIKQLGVATGSTRTADQTDQALFWADGMGSYTPPGHWNQIAQQVATAKGQSLSANARLFAQLNVALADAAIACWDAKYTYGYWRPETAIQNADADNNAATTVDNAWRPLLITPPHPEYVSGHSTFSAAAAGVLAATFGDNTAFSTTSATLPGVSRSFNSFSQAAAEAGRSRVYGGIHYEFTNQAGNVLGGQVADAVLARFALTQDAQAPVVVVNASPAATNTNPTITGQVLDNLSGVTSASYRIDNGATQPLALTANGGFSITTALATDGTADGAHTVTIAATDAAGNESTASTIVFTLGHPRAGHHAGQHGRWRHPQRVQPPDRNGQPHRQQPHPTELASGWWRHPPPDLRRQLRPL